MVVAGIIGLGAARSISPGPQANVRAERTRFFIEKTHADSKYDLVIVGDSRALRGIAPSVMEAELPGLNVFNFAFHAGGFNREIFHAAERLLDPGSESPMILIAPTPLGFMDWKQGNDQYREYRSKPIDQVILYRDMYPVAEFFSPISPMEPLRASFGLESANRPEEVFGRSGWIATNQDPFDSFADLTTLSEQLESNRVDPLVVDGVMEQVCEWSESGVRVYGVFVPAYAPREAMEDSMLGFDRARFVARFGANGGHVLRIQGDGYITYDGSHLVEESARRFSKALGSSIAHHLAQAGRPSCDETSISEDMR